MTLPINILLRPKQVSLFLSSLSMTFQKKFSILKAQSFSNLREVHFWHFKNYCHCFIIPEPGSRYVFVCQFVEEQIWMFMMPKASLVFCSTFYYLFIFNFRICRTSYLTVPRRVLCPLRWPLILVTMRIKELFQFTKWD